MATNFPGSQDSFTNPTSSDTLDSPDHAAQHANVNDAVEAIELALLDGAPLKIDDSNERVGIGTTSPDDKLHVVGDVTIEVSDDGSAAQPEVTLHRGSASPADGDYLGQVKFSGKNDAGQTVNYAKITGKISDVTDTTEDGLIEIANISGGSQSIGYRFTSSDLKLINGRGLQVDGNVGIGTTSPATKLDVVDSAPTLRLSSSATVPTSNTELQAIDFYQSDSSGGAGVSARIVGSANNSSGAQNIEFHTGQAGSGTVAERMRIDSNGNVGIGTTSPTGMLHISGSDPKIWLTDTDTNADSYVSGSSSVGSLILSADENNEVGSSQIAFKVDGSDRMVVQSSGNVGIGTTSPSQVLDVNGDIVMPVGNGIMFDRSGSDSHVLYKETAGSSTYGAGDDVILRNPNGARIRLQTNGTNDRMAITNTGKVGIGTTSPVDMFDVGKSGNAGSFRVHATGGGESFRVSGSVVRSSNIVNLTTASAANVFINTSNNSIYRSTSSGKYKTAIETLDVEHADKIFDLRPVWYRSTTGNDPAEYSYYGLIAEEVADVDPRLVHFGADPDCGCVEDEEGHIEHEQACLTEPEGVFYERLVPHLINVVQRQQAQIDALTARIEALEA